MTSPTDDRLLALYLQDHDAGAAGGLALFRRVAGGHRDPEVRRALTEIIGEVEDEREFLRDLLTTLGAEPSRLKPVLAVVGERIGRLKLNGSLISRSPLTDLVELEALRIAVEGKAAGWRLLRMIAAEGDDRLDAGRLDGFLARTAEHAETLERLRLKMARETLRAEAPLP